MPVSSQLVIDCADPDPLAHFWAEALHYVLAPPPEGFASWDDFFRSIGVPEEELGIGADSIVDPNGEGPRVWFQVVPERKSIKNRLHLDLSVGPDARDGEVERLEQLGATVLARVDAAGSNHVTMADPEGNEFDVQ